MVPSAGSARPQLKRGLMSSAVIFLTRSSMGVSLAERVARPAGAGLSGLYLVAPPYASPGSLSRAGCRWGNGRVWQAARSLRRFVVARSLAACLAARWSSLKLMVSINGVGRVRSKHHRGTTMEHYAGIDVSLECSSVCVVDASGKIIREGKVASEPEALVAWFGSLGFSLMRIGLEAGPQSQWLFAAFRTAGLAVELLETRHVRKAFETMPVKSDRNDARGIAQLMRLGWFRPVHCKSLPAQEVRVLLTARKLVQSKLYDIEMSLRGMMRGFGLKVGPTTPKRFAGRVREDRKST